MISMSPPAVAGRRILLASLDRRTRRPAADKPLGAATHPRPGSVLPGAHLARIAPPRPPPGVFLVVHAACRQPRLPDGRHAGAMTAIARALWPTGTRRRNRGGTRV